MAFPFFIPLSLEMSHHVRQGGQEVSAVKGKAALSQRQTCFLQQGVEISMWLVLVGPTSLACKPSAFDSKVSSQWTF